MNLRRTFASLAMERVSMQVGNHMGHEHQAPMVGREIPAFDHEGSMPRRRWLRTAFVSLVFAFLSILTVGAPQASAQSVATKTCPPLSQGFWKNHASAWKVTSLT